MSKTCNPNSDKRNDPLFVCNPKSGRYVKRKACKQPPPAGVSPRTHDCDPVTGKWVLKAVPPPNIPTSAADKVLSNPDILSSYFHSGHLSKAQRDALSAAMGGKTQTSAEYKKRCRDEIANELNLGRPIVKEDVADDGLYLKYKDCIFKIGRNQFKEHINNFTVDQLNQKILSFFYFYEGTTSQDRALLVRTKQSYITILLNSLFSTYDHFQIHPNQPQPVLPYEDFIHLQRITEENHYHKKKELYYILLFFIDFKKTNAKEKALQIFLRLKRLGHIHQEYYENLIINILKKLTT